MEQKVKELKEVGRIGREALLYSGCFAHVFTRAIEKRKIFEKLEDFEFFKEFGGRVPNPQ